MLPPHIYPRRRGGGQFHLSIRKDQMDVVSQALIVLATTDARSISEQIVACVLRLAEERLQHRANGDAQPGD
jgi:hypothetical protein